MISCKERNALIVDDKPAIRDILASIISNKGHQTYTVSNGKSGVVELDEKVYDFLTSSRRPYLAKPFSRNEIIDIVEREMTAR